MDNIVKTFRFTTIIAGILMVLSIGLQAQTTLTKLNQLELIKQMFGKWQLDVGKDSIALGDVIPYGTGFEGSSKYITKDKIYSEGKALYGYNKSLDKFVGGTLTKGKAISLWALWFISDNKYVWIPYSHISEAENSPSKYIGEFRSPYLRTETHLVNNLPGEIYTYIRVKE